MMLHIDDILEVTAGSEPRYDFISRFLRRWFRVDRRKDISGTQWVITSVSDGPAIIVDPVVPEIRETKP